MSVKIFIQETFITDNFQYIFWYKQINWTLDYSYVIDDIFDVRKDYKKMNNLFSEVGNFPKVSYFVRLYKFHQSFMYYEFHTLSDFWCVV